MPFFRRKQKDRPIERVLGRKRMQEYLKASKQSVFPPYSKDQWNYWHIMTGGTVSPITANQLLREYREWKQETYVSPKLEAAAQNLYPMRPELSREIERLKGILAAHGKPFNLLPGAPKSHIQRAERRFGQRLDPDLCALYAFSDGGWKSDICFAVGEEFPVINFKSLEESLEDWRGQVEGKSGNQKYGRETDKRGHLTHDPRIRRGLWFPPQWWGFAEGNDASALLDYRPSRLGKPGQVIIFNHDPDVLGGVTDSFLDFFRKSNELLETRWAKILGEEG